MARAGAVAPGLVLGRGAGRGVGAAEPGGGRRRAASARGLRAPLLPLIRIHFRQLLRSLVPSGIARQTRVDVLD
ncbi:hypothetical protein AV530_013862 [Patagioenas fasciata monilis]|uniref:Uncharacterized protein n=1 Tax=Patagioenas fasciata monilis TaxID=372326 RepID=A0A1V4L1U8_PATFA|nr:hypothetical protein AV530_013862 [Patagioenas fasciata monilis]